MEQESILVPSCLIENCNNEAYADGDKTQL
jgi:hypothetical protein